MRVIAGRAKGHRLKMVPGDSTRPITDRVKENLFNILGDWVIGTRWLDLFAGTGQVGIEALSRGAEQVVFVDSAKSAIRTVWDNLRWTRLVDEAIVVHRDAFSYLRGGTIRPSDVVYVAPPQYQELWKEVLMVVARKPERYISKGGVVIVQIDPAEYEELGQESLELTDRRTYGRTMLCFYEVKDDHSSEI